MECVSISLPLSVRININITLYVIGNRFSLFLLNIYKWLRKGSMAWSKKKTATGHMTDEKRAERLLLPLNDHLCVQQHIEIKDIVWYRCLADTETLTVAFGKNLSCVEGLNFSPLRPLGLLSCLPWFYQMDRQESAIAFFPLWKRFTVVGAIKEARKPSNSIDV